MKRMTYLFLILLSVISLSAGSVLAADTSLHEVYQAAEGGNLKKAQSLMDQVLRDHPNSAKAHFVEAELLVKEGRLEMAKTELNTAERLAPGLPFAKPESVQAMKHQLGEVTHGIPAGTTHALPSIPSDFPWGMLLLGLGVIAAIVYFVRSLNRPQLIQPRGVGGYAAPGGGFSNGYAQPLGAGGPGPVGPASGGMGSGILGSLATGAAVGAGIVAGEALMHKVFDGNSGSSHGADAPTFQPIDNSPALGNSDDMGGSDFGISDSGSWDDNSGGTSGDDW